MMMNKLVRYTKNYRKYMFLCPLFVAIEVVFEIFIPFLMADIIDKGIQGGDIGLVWRLGGAMVILAIFALIFGALSSIFAARASMGFACNLRKGLFDKIQAYSFANIDKFSTPSLVTRLTADITNIQMAFMMMIRILVRAPLMLFCATFMAFWINSSLVTVFLVAIPFLAIAISTIVVLTFPRFQAMLKKYDSMDASVQENLIAARVVKAYVRGEHEKQKFAVANNELKVASLRAEKLLMWDIPLMQFTMYACLVAILFFGGKLIIDGVMEVGQLISFISYVGQILMSLMMIAMVLINMVLSRASLSRIVEVLDENIDIADAKKPEGTDDNRCLVGDEVKDGRIEFDHVYFKYGKDSQTDNLTDICLKVKSGQTVGIIGGTGSAKTTLVQLIPRLYDVTGGRLLVGGRDVKSYSIADLRKAVGMVLQKNLLFTGTIRDNLKWGDIDATDEEVEKAARLAEAHEFIMSFPLGYDTVLGQGGVNVSGGQKQRLCIARALLKHPKIIILDDSTSAVDMATDALIRQSLKTELSNTTTLIIAQRIASVEDADLIIVLDDGEIVGQGAHEELLETSSIYREVYESQKQSSLESEKNEG